MEITFIKYLCLVTAKGMGFFMRMRHLFLPVQNQTDDIPINIQNISMLSFDKKRRAKNAICQLLSITPHSVEEIADHFEISPELVKALLMQLIKANLVANVPGDSNKFYLIKN